MERPWFMDKDKQFVSGDVSEQLLLNAGQSWLSGDYQVDPTQTTAPSKAEIMWIKRSSHASDTSSAYSGSDIMQSSTDDLDIDFSCPPESDGEEGFSESLIVRDQVREYLEKEPSKRGEDDIEVLLDFMQHMPAFSNMTLTIRRALCAVMSFAVIPKAETTIYGDGQEMDCWSVILNGHIEISRPDGTIEHLHMGDSFGVTLEVEKVMHCGTMKTKVDDCQFVHIKQQDYRRILHQGNESILRLEERGDVVLVVEKRRREDGKEGQVVLRGTPEKLILQLIENNVIDQSYIEDFLLTHRTFVKSPLDVARKLQSWLQDPATKERAARILLLWVNSHYKDFESNAEMIEYLEKFEVLLEAQRMIGHLRLLNMAYEARAHPRLVVLSRSTRDEILYFSIIGGLEKKSGVFVAKVEKGSKAYEAGLMRGDQILEVNKHNFERIQHDNALKILRGSTQLAITVKSNLSAFRKVLQLTADNPSKSLPSKTIAAVESGGTSNEPGIAMPRLQQSFFKMSLQMKEDSKEHANQPLCRKNSSVSDDSISERPLSLSSPDLSNNHSSSAVSGASGFDFPDQVIKVYRADQTFKYLLILKETMARQVVMLALSEFGITDPSGNYSLNEVTFEECGLVKTRHLPDQLTNLAERIHLNSRYYLRNTKSMDPLVPDDLVEGIVRECQTTLLELDVADVAIQLMRQDLRLFKDIGETEYVYDLFDLACKAGCLHLNQFQQLVNREMFWVVTEVCSEPNVIKRAKVIKQFIKLARFCKMIKNFNSMFAILSGLGHGAVSRLRQTWDRVPAKYVKLFEEMQQLMDPSRNMSKYRNMLSAHMARPPVIPFFPLVKKDLTFIHYGNDSRVDGLVNFDKLRMIAKEVHMLNNLASGVLPEYTRFCPSSTTGEYTSLSASALVTMKRKKSSGTVPNLKRLYDDMLMSRKARTYLTTMKVNEDETELSQMSNSLEPQGKSLPRKVDPSTTTSVAFVPPSTESLILNPMFGAESQKAVCKLMTLADKVKPLDQKKTNVQRMKSVPSSPVRTGKKSRPVKLRPLPAVDLSKESSSVLGVGIQEKASKDCPRIAFNPVLSGISKKALDTDSGNGSVTSSVADSQSIESISDASNSPLFRRAPGAHFTHQSSLEQLPTSALSIPDQNRCAVEHQYRHANYSRISACNLFPSQPAVVQQRPLRPPTYDVAIRYSSALRPASPNCGYLEPSAHRLGHQLLPDYHTAAIAAVRMRKERVRQTERHQNPTNIPSRQRSYSYDAMIDLPRTGPDVDEDGYDPSDDESCESGLVSAV